MPRPSDQLLTVAICTRNRAALLRPCVETVMRQIDDDTRVLIVDNGSTDDTHRIGHALAAEHPCVDVVREPRVGLSHARNAALAAATSRYVVFLDDDAISEPGWLAGYRRFLEAPPSENIGAAGGAVRPRYGTPPPAWLASGEHTLHVSDVACPMAGPSWPWGCNFVCDRIRALDVGGFCTHLGRCGTSMGAHEETDLFRRLRSAGYEVWWLPDAPIRHDIPSHRSTIAFHCYAAFAAGRSTATLRLREHASPWSRLPIIVGRLVTMPVLGLAYLIVAAATGPLHRGRTAMRAAARAMRAFGMAWQFVLDAPRVLLRQI